jgi:hypothetical protein
MNNVIYSDIFEAKLRRFAKKFPSILDEIEELATQLEQNADIGTSLGSGLHKIRLSVASKGGGKSGGFRVITYVIYQMSNSNEVYLLTLYDKSEEDTVKKDELVKIAKKIVQP